MSKSKPSTTSWAFLVLGVGGMILLTILKVQSQSFDSSGYGPSNLEAGLRAAQNHYEFSQMMETIYAPLMILSLVVTLLSFFAVVKGYKGDEK